MSRSVAADGGEYDYKAAGDALDDVVAACVSASVGSLEAVMTVDQPERGGVVTLGSMGKLFVALRRRD